MTWLCLAAKTEGGIVLSCDPVTEAAVHYAQLDREREAARYGKQCSDCVHFYDHDGQEGFCTMLKDYVACTDSASDCEYYN
jgi:hypothetical protein